jgi:xanthine dehydrogenase FAD-binding subunit
LVHAAAQAIIGTALQDADLDALATAAIAAATPISDKRGTADFRNDIVGVLVKRAARIAYARAKGAVK